MSEICYVAFRAEKYFGGRGRRTSAQQWPQMVPNHPKWGPGTARGSAEKVQKLTKKWPKKGQKGPFLALFGLFQALRILLSLFWGLPLWPRR